MRCIISIRRSFDRQGSVCWVFLHAGHENVTLMRGAKSSLRMRSKPTVGLAIRTCSMVLSAW